MPRALFGRRLDLLPYMGLLLLAALAACQDIESPVASVRVRYDGSTPEKLHYVKVIAGADKLYWYDVEAGSSVGADLRPGEGAVTQLTVLYQYDPDAEMRSWDGPSFPIGESYRINVRIGDDGRISHRACISPCDLPDN